MMRAILRTWNFIYRHPLGARNPMQALRRWVQWQLGARLLGQPLIMPFVGSSVLVMEPGMTGATGNWYCGLHEFADMALLLHLLRPGDLFVDVGANIGSYTVLASAVAGAHSLSVEPVVETFARLERNLRVNNIKPLCETHCCAVGRTSGTVLFTTTQDTTNHVISAGEAGTGINVAMETLDGLLGQRSPLMWKIDVEGFEKEVLAGAVESLNNQALQVVLMESDDGGLGAVMEKAGFVRAGYDPFTRQISCGANASGPNNTLWIRDAGFVAARCQAAPSRTVAGVTF